jgi:transcriptional regulator with XRE-family HTH domain
LSIQQNVELVNTLKKFFCCKNQRFVVLFYHKTGGDDLFKFKECREQAKLTQKEAAISLGVSVQSVSNWELGNREPSLETVLRLCDLYGVTSDHLLGRTEMPVSVVRGNPPAAGKGHSEIVIPLDGSVDAPAEFDEHVRKLIRQELSRRGI